MMNMIDMRMWTILNINDECHESFDNDNDDKEKLSQLRMRVN